MDRRIALTALAGAALAGPALAQTSGAPAAGMAPSGGMASGGTASSSSATSGMHAMGPAEMTHMQKTMMGGMFLLETGRVGMEKARNADVKQFAKFESDEQTGLSEVLRSMMDPSMGGMSSAAAMGGASSTANASSMAGPAPTGAPMAAPAAGAAMSTSAGMPTMQMDADKTAMLTKLRGAEGVAFDRMFLESQLMGHQEDLRVQEEYLQTGRNREHINVAKLARAHIKEHIVEVQGIQRELKG